MGATNLSGIEAAGVHKILSMLDALRHSQTGSVIYRQVERMLDDVVDNQHVVERAYVTLINQLLSAYLNHLREGSPLQVQVRLLQARLQPPLTAGDLEILRDYVELYATQIEAIRNLDSGLFQNAVNPLLESFGIIDTQPVAEVPAQETPVEAEPVPEPVEIAEPEAAAPVEQAYTEARQSAEPPSARLDRVDVEEEHEWPFSRADDRAEARRAEEQQEQDSGEVHPDQSDQDESIPLEQGTAVADENQVDNTYRSHLDSKRRDIQKLQSTLNEQVKGTIAQNEEFGVLLEVVLGELRHAGEGKELEDLRWTLIREIEKLTKGHHDLAEKLDNTHHYLQLIESDSRQLSDELTRVRLLSLTDELTGLPNRRAFLRRIEDEVARVQRYGFPLSLALIDLDHFKQINDKYGHAGGDEVLQLYSKSILSIFRHHDLVARYGGEEFAVLLPNTDAEGSMRALTKVRKRAQETRWQANGEMIPIPTFSSGVSLYKPGETASAFIERADKALYRAKRLGRNRVELDATYSGDTESEHDEPSSSDDQSGERHQRGDN
ncbi:diguanylate cyclase (GGDEF)-like protein [Thiogranum longum]|uniref:diguanylate cyclase n=1 Tax=Thiogranum longum TaxID=1537524 RepID=A0A4R1HAF5_9GAMM|nr:GGDEF domain-containing protein [Thiogranum longum]TCK18917.1 diguanylate cyclase (GGDEF)-like protein [Thiogranum longum]